MTVGLRPSSSNTSSIRMCASPRAPPPPSASAIDGRTTGKRRLAHLQGFAGGFHGHCARRDARCHPGACHGISDGGTPSIAVVDPGTSPRDDSSVLPMADHQRAAVRAEKRQQRGQRVLGVLLGQEMARHDLGARQLVAAPGAPDLQRLGAASAEVVAAPEQKRRAGDLAARGQVRLVEPPVDGGAGAIVLADGVHARRLLQQGAVVRQRLGREGGERRPTSPSSSACARGRTPGPCQSASRAADRAAPGTPSGRRGSPARPWCAATPPPSARCRPG